jgi:polar amino acid transport system substrate-binding protein
MIADIMAIYFVYAGARATVTPGHNHNRGTTMKRTLLALALAGAALMSGQAFAETLKIGTEGAYPPFNFQDSTGKLGGFDVEIGLALCEKMKVDCEVVAQDWDGIIPGLIAKKYDMIIASMFITEERKKQVAFSDPYYLAAMTHAAPKGAGITDFTNEGMKGKTIGAQSGTTQGDYVAAVYPDADIKLYPTQDEVNLDMANGRLDLQVGDMIPLLDWVTKNEDGKACCELIGKPITDPKFVGEGVGIAVRQDDNDLREKLNAALKAIREDGTYQKINDKYFSIDIYTMK